MPQRLGDLGKSMAYGATAGMVEPARAALSSMLPYGHSYQQELDYIRQEREQRRAESPLATMAAELTGSLATPGMALVKSIPRAIGLNTGLGAIAGYNEAGNVSDAATGAALGGAASGMARMIPTPPPVPQAQTPRHSADLGLETKLRKQPTEQLAPRLQQLRDDLVSSANIRLTDVLDLDKLPREYLEQVTAAQGRYLGYANLANHMEIQDPTFNQTLLRVLSITKKDYDNTLAEAMKHYSKPPPSMAEKAAQTMRTAPQTIVPMTQFVTEAMARYQAGSQK